MEITLNDTLHGASVLTQTGRTRKAPSKLVFRIWIALESVALVLT